MPTQQQRRDQLINYNRYLKPRLVYAAQSRDISSTLCKTIALNPKNQVIEELAGDYSKYSFYQGQI